MRPAQIAGGEVQIGVRGQIARPQLGLGEALEHHAMGVEQLDALLRRRTAAKKVMEKTARHEDLAPVFAELDREDDAILRLFPARLPGKAEKRHEASRASKRPTIGVSADILNSGTIRRKPRTALVFATGEC